MATVWGGFEGYIKNRSLVESQRHPQIYLLSIPSSSLHGFDMSVRDAKSLCSVWMLELYVASLLQKDLHP